eukprot:TRINITY_DN5286_c0_g2_i1.p1 TRINITY_DN5286_c0_g2~~TRINITY_DN5286_c0_g2_i1.p1  ORF type:complete len:370 (+),score=111.77 TRINITY_DN5286_c0_g2_i1:511-1620(+)
MAVGYSILYLLFIVVVVILEYRSSQKKKEKERALLDRSVNADADLESTTLVEPPNQNNNNNDSKKEPANVAEKSDSNHAVAVPPPEDQSPATPVREVPDKITHPPRVYLEGFKETWETAGWIEKAYIPYKVAANFLRDIFIPITDEEYYHRNNAVLWPWVTPIFVFATFEWGVQYLVYASPVAIILSILLYRLDAESATTTYQLWFSLAGLIAGVAMLNFLATFLIDYLKFVEVVSGLPSTFIGMTLIAWGNSAPDLFNDIALAKVGLSLMAVTGVFAGQLFNLLFGFGVVLLRQTLELGPAEFGLFNPEFKERNLVILVILGFAVVNLSQTLIYAIINKFKIGEKWGWWLCMYYFLFCLVIFLIVFFV